MGPWEVARRQVAQRLKVRLAYRVDFLVNMLGETLIASVGVMFLGALFSQIPSLGGWSAPEVVFCWGFAEAIVGLFFVFFGGLYQLNIRYLLGGELDRVLLRPVDPYLQVLLDNLGLEDVPIALLGLGVMAWAAPELHVEPWRWALLPVFLAGGTAVLGGFLTGVSSVGFHLHHRGTAVGLAFQLSTFTRYPIDLFAKPLQALITWVLPLAFAGFYGAVFFLGRPEWLPYAVAQPFVGGLCLWLGYRAWRFGLATYASSGT